MTQTQAKGIDSSNETQEDTHYVLGGTHVDIRIAEQLQAAGPRAAIADDSYTSDDIPGFEGDPATVDGLVEPGVETASAVIIATDPDLRNLLIAQLARAKCDVQRVIAFVNSPDRASLFADAGHEPFCVTTAVAESLGETI